VSGFRPARDADRAAWDAFVAGRPEADPLQAWAWGEANALAGEVPVRGLVDAADGGISAVAQILVRPAGFGRSVGYVPHGPVWRREADDAEETVDTLLDGIRALGAERRAIVVKLDPRAGAGPASDERAARGPATGVVDPIRDALVGRGLRLTRHDLQAPTTRVVELLDGGDALLATFDKDARNLIRRSAREGVATETDRAGDETAIRAFHDLLEATSSRAGFRIRSTAFLETLARGLADSGGWYLTIARLGDRPIAGAAALRVGDRAIYAYGASLREPALKHANGAYAALAGTMRALAEDGCRTLDLWGVVEPGDEATDPSWQGFSAFKRQFGGNPVRHPGTFDLVVSPFWDHIRDLRERAAGAVRR
jgi:lipid II:glycine glycyltransferase (peptidoglycan interpeptide bridge formation enzyme)